MKKEKINKKQIILDYLYDDGLTSTTKLASNIRSNYNDTMKLLEELLKEKKLTMLKTPLVTYWDLKKSNKQRNIKLIKEVMK